MPDVISWFSAHGGQILDILAYLFAPSGLAAIVAAVTPTPADDAAVVVVRKGIDLLGGNFGHARNADPVAKEGE